MEDERVPAPNAKERLSIAEMVSEAMREAAVLVAVFSPLDGMIGGRPLTGWWILGTLALVGTLFWSGVGLERKR